MEYNVPVIQASISEIPEDIRSSQFMSREKSEDPSLYTYQMYARVVKLILVRKQLMDLLKRLARTKYDNGGV